VDGWPAQAGRSPAAAGGLAVGFALGAGDGLALGAPDGVALGRAVGVGAGVEATPSTDGPGGAGGVGTTSPPHAAASVAIPATATIVATRRLQPRPLTMAGLSPVGGASGPVWRRERSETPDLGVRYAPSMAETMRAFVITGPGAARVEEVARPVAAPGEVVVDVERAGVCGTDVEFFSGEMAYLHSGEAAYPIRIGHEWTGTVASIGDGVDDAWLGRRVVGDTMLGCGHCVRCRSGRQHLCADRSEVGIRHGWPGALAEQLRVPASSLYVVPDGVDTATGALIEPGANAWRTVEALALGPGDRVLIVGAGAIGLLAALIARARGLAVDLLGRSESSRQFAESLGFERTWSAERPPTDRFDGVIDASHDPASPARTVELVVPGGRVAWIGLSGAPSLVDSRRIVLADVTVVGVLSGSPGLAGMIELVAAGRVNPSPLVAAVVSLDEVAEALSGQRGPDWGGGPKVQVDPHR
jgi:threonine dehydrogenase-like Zn-dependent dehydrogenase